MTDPMAFGAMNQSGFPLHTPFGDLRVVEWGGTSAPAYCSLQFAIFGATVEKFVTDRDAAGEEHTYRDLGKRVHATLDDLPAALREADVLVTDIPVERLVTHGLLDADLADLSMILVLPFSHDSERPMSSLTAMAATGHLALSGEEGREPVSVWGEQPEHLAGLLAFGVGCRALALRSAESADTTVVSLSVSELLASLEFSVTPWFSYTGQVRRRGPRNSGVGPLSFPVAFYRCIDGYVFVNAAGEHHWQFLAIATGRDELITDLRFVSVADRKRNFDLLNRELSPWFEVRTRADVIRTLQEHRVPAAPLETVAEAVNNEQLVARGFFRDFVGPDGQVTIAPYAASVYPGVRSVYDDGPKHEESTQ